ASSIQYQYDANGNRISRSSPEGTTTYTWDYENHLIGVTTPEGISSNYTYDPFGRRISKTVNGSTTNYSYDSEDILFETVDGSIGNIYIHGPGIDEPLALLGKKGATYYHADGLGSIVAMTDDKQKIVQAYEYDSYGNQHDSKNSIKQPYTYTGREHDRETGLYYYRARYYDPEVGRFISEDPIGFAGGDVNLYGYVLANSVNYVDPSGEFMKGVRQDGSVYVDMFKGVPLPPRKDPLPGTPVLTDEDICVLKCVTGYAVTELGEQSAKKAILYSVEKYGTTAVKKAAGKFVPVYNVADTIRDIVEISSCIKGCYDEEECN
ncbi:MAG: RHS repeat-associated core domain-containing protein, partial [Desulfuromonadales bacterium]|nr:RHS repeat-associated core domain-containing protein [Desulfuromonadales bacterium]